MWGWNIIVWIIIGLIAGAVAGRVVEGHGFGIVVDIIVGLVGALVGGAILAAIGVGGNGFLWTLLTAFIGAVVFLWILRLLASAFGGGRRRAY